MLKFFRNINSPEEAHKRYKELSKELHPDINKGNGKTFVKMKAEYEQLLLDLPKKATKKETSENFSVKIDHRHKKEINNLTNSLVNLFKIVVEDNLPILAKDLKDLFSNY